MRQEITSLPDGEWSFVDFIDVSSPPVFSLIPANPFFIVWWVAVLLMMLLPVWIKKAE